MIYIKNSDIISKEAKQEIKYCIGQTMAMFGFKNLKIKVSWKRMITTVGISKWAVHKNLNEYKVSNLEIILSETLWPYLFAEEKQEIIIHECCHLITAIKNKFNADNPHDINWSNLMKKMGKTSNPYVNAKILDGLLY